MDLYFGTGTRILFTASYSMEMAAISWGKRLMILGVVVSPEIGRSTSHLHEGYEKNTIAVLASGPDIAVYANNQLIHYERDVLEPYLLGSVGFYVTSGSNMYIDNFSIRPVDLKTDPDNPPATIDLRGVQRHTPFLN
jgi:hypothetical protein